MGFKSKDIESKGDSASELLNYGSYLKVPEITSLQHPLSKPPAHDEMLFIVIHQVYELWFKQVLFEMNALIRYLSNEDYLACFRLLDRISEIFKVLIQQVDVLETMTPVEFNRFRSRLNPASGFQSMQFRELELLTGANPAHYEKFLKLNPEWADVLNKRIGEPSLRNTFLELLIKKELITEDTPDTVVKAIDAIYHDNKHQALHNLCEYLITFDEQFMLWRFRHVQMVERMIGRKRGTGGSLGVAYLQSTLEKRFFPELWEARTHMNGS